METSLLERSEGFLKLVDCAGFHKGVWHKSLGNAAETTQCGDLYRNMGFLAPPENDLVFLTVQIFESNTPSLPTEVMIKRNFRLLSEYEHVWHWYQSSLACVRDRELINLINTVTAVASDSCPIYSHESFSLNMSAKNTTLLLLVGDACLRLFRCLSFHHKFRQNLQMKGLELISNLASSFLICCCCDSGWQKTASVKWGLHEAERSQKQ